MELRVLLVLDNHSSHLNVETLTLAKENSAAANYNYWMSQYLDQQVLRRSSRYIQPGQDPIYL